MKKEAKEQTQDSKEHKRRSRDRSQRALDRHREQDDRRKARSRDPKRKGSIEQARIEAIATPNYRH